MAGTEDQYQPLQWLWAVRDTEFDNPLERLLAYHMQTRAGADGTCYPSLAELCLVLGVKGTQTKKLRASLVQRGFLELVTRGDGRGNSSVYGLTLPSDKPDTLTPAKPDTRSVHQEGHKEIQAGQEVQKELGTELSPLLAAPPGGTAKVETTRSTLVAIAACWCPGCLQSFDGKTLDHAEDAYFVHRNNCSECKGNEQPLYERPKQAA